MTVLDKIQYGYNLTHIEYISVLEQIVKTLEQKLDKESNFSFYLEGQLHNMVDKNSKYEKALLNIANSDGWLVEPNPSCTIEQAYDRCVDEAVKALDLM